MKQPQSDQALFLENISHIGYFSTDLERIVVEWNSACEELFGYTKKEAIGKRLEELIFPDYLTNYFVDDFNQRSATYGEEVEYRNAEGKTILLYANTMFTS
jgi:PAS domain S-box-containing protein